MVALSLEGIQQPLRLFVHIETVGRTAGPGAGDGHGRTGGSHRRTPTTIAIDQVNFERSIQVRIDRAGAAVHTMPERSG